MHTGGYYDYCYLIDTFSHNRLSGPSLEPSMARAPALRAYPFFLPLPPPKPPRPSPSFFAQCGQDSDGGFGRGRQTRSMGRETFLPTHVTRAIRHADGPHPYPPRYTGEGFLAHAYLYTYIFMYIQTYVCVIYYSKRR